MCPQTTPVATKSHLCGPKPTRVTTIASCLSSAYLCSYHNTSTQLSSADHACQKPTFVVLTYPCSHYNALLMCSAMPGRHQSPKPHLWSLDNSCSHYSISDCHQSTVLSLPPQHPCGPQPSHVAIITLLCVLILPQWPEKKPSLWSPAYPCSKHSIMLVLSIFM